MNRWPLAVKEGFTIRWRSNGSSTLALLFIVVVFIATSFLLQLKFWASFKVIQCWSIASWEIVWTLYCKPLIRTADKSITPFTHIDLKMNSAATREMMHEVILAWFAITCVVLIRLASNKIHTTHLLPCGANEERSSSIGPNADELTDWTLRMYMEHVWSNISMICHNSCCTDQIGFKQNTHHSLIALRSQWRTFEFNWT